MAHSSVYRGEYEQSSTELNLHNHGSRKRSRSPERYRAPSIAFSFSRPVLDCPNCSKPFTVLVFQCPNGHLSCVRCYRMKRFKCHSCSEMIGEDDRCRAMENVIEAVKVSCCNKKHGCRKEVSYSLKLDHEKICHYAPNYSCPFTACSFRGSPRRLQQHIIQEHEDYLIDFDYGTTFSVHPGPTSDFAILREVAESDLFIVILDEELLVKCLEPDASKGKFNYEVTIRSDNSCLRYQSTTEAIMSIGNWNEISRKDSFVVPRHFFRFNGFLWLDICIFSKDTNNAGVQIRSKGDQAGTS